VVQGVHAVRKTAVAVAVVAVVGAGAGAAVVVWIEVEGGSQTRWVLAGSDKKVPVVHTSEL